ncbi:MAG: MGMT family protein [Rudaea sp.]
MLDEIYERIYTLVREIPPGKVTTYGHLAAMVGLSDSRIAGEAMNASSGLPWQRVINSRGEISIRGATGARQRELLEMEGVAFEQGRVDLSEYGWTPDPAWLQANGYRLPPPFPPKKKKDEENGGQLSLF